MVTRSGHKLYLIPRRHPCVYFNLISFVMFSESFDLCACVCRCPVCIQTGVRWGWIFRGVGHPLETSTLVCFWQWFTSSDQSHHVNCSVLFVRAFGVRTGPKKGACRGSHRAVPGMHLALEFFLFYYLDWWHLPSISSLI